MGFGDLLGEAESARLEGGALDDACTALQGLVSGVALKDKVLKQACEPADLHAYEGLSSMGTPWELWDAPAHRTCCHNLFAWHAMRNTEFSDDVPRIP